MNISVETAGWEAIANHCDTCAVTENETQIEQIIQVVSEAVKIKCGFEPT